MTTIGRQAVRDLVYFQDSEIAFRFGRWLDEWREKELDYPVATKYQWLDHNIQGGDMKAISRRRFIQKSLVMGAALTAFPTTFTQRVHASNGKKLIVHPEVDNLRVVGITDNGMTSDINPANPWEVQNRLVVEKAVWENIDKLACGLTQTGEVSKAWQTVFLKPPKKSWSETVVAIKTNNILQQHTRSAVLAKICHTFTDIIGVKPENIHIYDACHGSEMSKTTPFSGLPEGCRIENTWGGSIVKTDVPKPWRDGNGKAECLSHLVAGYVDILVNVALCKGHFPQFGGFTMTMKNHFGTFTPMPSHSPGGGFDYLLGINKTPEILGKMDKKTGKILFPRQQLCVVDALFASKGGPGGNPTHQPNFLAMGVLSPIVDYILATKFRGEKMGWKPIIKETDRLLTEFGYSIEDLPSGGEITAV